MVRFAWLSLWAFIRITTNPRAFERPLNGTEAENAVASWLGQPIAGIVEPGERHFDILRVLMKEGQVTGPLLMDATLATIALEHGAVLHTTDRDFARSQGLKLRNPITPAR